MWIEGMEYVVMDLEICRGGGGNMYRNENKGRDGKGLNMVGGGM